MAASEERRERIERAESRAANALDRAAEHAERIAIAQVRSREHNAMKAKATTRSSLTSTAQGDEAEAKRQRLDSEDAPPDGTAEGLELFGRPEAMSPEPQRPQGVPENPDPAQGSRKHRSEGNDDERVDAPREEAPDGEFTSHALLPDVG